jgi:hypothetical protein
VGEVTAVDLNAGTFTLLTASGPLTFVVPDAEPRPGHNPLPPADLQVGDLVEVLYLVNGTLVAAAGNTLTGRDRVSAVVLTTDAATDLRLNGKAVTVAQLAALLAGGTFFPGRCRVSVKSALTPWPPGGARL